MATSLTSLLAEVERQRKLLNKLTSVQLESKSSKDSLRSLAECYFGEVRPLLVDPPEHGYIASLDGEMQALLALCHKRGRVAAYIESLRKIKALLVKLDAQLVVAGSATMPGTRSEMDERVLATLRSLVPSAAFSYEQALIDLQNEDRLSWRGPATDLREALRETLDRLAPDSDVTAAPGYKTEPDARGPTMKQKVRFILRSREVSRAISAPTEDAVNAVEESLGTFVRSVYTRSSVSTHTSTSKQEVLRVLDMVRVVLSELLNVR